MQELFQDIFNSNKQRFVKMSLLSFISSLSSGLSIVILIPLLNFFDSFNFPNNSFILPADSMIRFALLLLLFVAIMICKALLTRYVTLMDNRLIQDYTQGLRLRLYDAIAQADWQKLIQYSRSHLLNLFNLDTGRISNTANLLVKSISLLLTAAVQISIALVMNFWLTLFILSCGAMLFWFFRPMLIKSKACGQRMREASVQFFEEIDDQISGIKEIRAYGISDSQRQRFWEATEAYKQSNLELTRIYIQPAAIYSISSAVLVALAFFVAQSFLALNTAKVVIMIYIFSRLWPIYISLQATLQNMMSTLPVYKAFSNTLEELSSQSASLKIPLSIDFQLCREIRLENVNFSYRSSAQKLLQNLSLVLPAQKVIALVGCSGAGKSTLVNLITGFLIPESGSILIDGIRLDSSNIAGWQKQISYVPQDPLLLHATIRENIQRFHPGLPEADLIAALKLAQAWEFVEKLPEGLDSLVGERGIRLSGGEKQRIVLARALAGSPQLIILDEATSSLDYENEYNIRNVIKSLHKQVTIIVIAHQLNTISSAEHILVMDNGKIVQQGSFAELIQQNEGYLVKMTQIE